MTPAGRSNHYVGHAIDTNLELKNGKWCNSGCLQYLLNKYEDAKCFITKIRSDATLRWGGDFWPKDVGHIDDSINSLAPGYYISRFKSLQENC